MGEDRPMMWWLVGLWLVGSAVVPVLCVFSMVTGYLRKRFANAPHDGAESVAAE